MRIHNLSFIVAWAALASTPLAVSEAFALDNDIVSEGCTVAQLRLPKAKECIDMIVKAGGTSHHVECSGGTISCCNDEPDSGGRPAGFCITIKKVVQTKRPKITVAPLETAQ
jgi:hypothetical protein